MENRKTGKFIAYSTESNSALIDLGEGKTWYNVAENAKHFFQNLKIQTDCEFGFSGNEIVFVKKVSNNQGQPQSQKQRNQSESDKYNMQMSKLKNNTNARISALDNATKIAMSDENLNTYQKKYKAIVNLRDEFLKFIEGENTSPEGEIPSN